MAFAPSDVASQENWNGAVQSRKINKNEMSLMVGVLVNDIIVSGEQDMCDEFFGQLKQRFPVKKNPGGTQHVHWLRVRA